MRENGFDYPLHPLQCLTWALFPVILLDFYWLLLPLLPGEATRWAVGTVYTAAAATTFFCAWITAAVDPRDPSVAAAAPPATNRLARCCEPLALWPPPVGEDTCRCYLCQVHVFASSKHCRFCDKCVLRFDHHCKWLNTRASARPGRLRIFVPGARRGRVGAPRRRPGDQVRRCQELRLLPRGDRVDVRLHDDAARAPSTWSSSWRCPTAGARPSPPARADTPSAASVASTRSWRSSARTPRCSSRSSC